MKPARVAIVMVLVLLAGAGGWFLVRSFVGKPGDPPATVAGPGSSSGETGKLVVLVVFDQFRNDYLERWSSVFEKDGFERLKREGVWFANAHIPYACTSTGPGHASIATGVPPSVHGIIENAWLERSADSRSVRLVYCVQPSREFALVPPLPANAGKPERGSENGFSPENLLAATVSDALRATPGSQSKVVSLSIKDRAAVLMGGKMNPANPPLVYCFDVRDGRFHTDAYYADGVPKWVSEFNANRKNFDEWVGKEWNRLRPDLDYNKLAGPDPGPGESYGYNQGQVFPHPMNKNAPNGGPEYYRALENSPFGSEMLLAFAKEAIAGENLGNRGATDLLCVSFSSNDLIGHQWGPDSWEVLDVTLRSDRIIQELLTHLDARLGKDRYTLVMTADHGICPIPESRKIPTADRRKPSTVLTELTAALDATFGPADQPGHWYASQEYAEDVWPWVYFHRANLQMRGIPFDAVCDYAAQFLGNRDYTLTAFTRKQIESGTLPPLPPDQEREAKAILAQVKLAYQPDRCGDVVVIPQRGVLMTKYPSGTSHGSPHSYDTHVPIVAFGAGVPALGRKDDAVSSLLVGPIVSAALGIAATGREAIPPGLTIAK